MKIKEAQELVENWINGVGGGYFSELTNMALLTEEVGETARIIARKYGDQVAKEGDLDKELGQELADVLRVLICIANQTGVDLEEELKRNLAEKEERDRERFAERREKAFDGSPLNEMLHRKKRGNVF